MVKVADRTSSTGTDGAYSTFANFLTNFMKLVTFPQIRLNSLVRSLPHRQRFYWNANEP